MGFSGLRWSFHAFEVREINMYKKYNNLLRSVLTFLVLFPILMIVMSIPAQAPGQGIKLNIDPHDTFVNSSKDEYHATMNTESAPHGGFFFLNLTIPKGYNFTLPQSGKTIAKYTWFKMMNDPKVIVIIISNNTVIETVDIRFSTDSGRTYRTKRGLPITNMVIGTTSLKFTKPSSISAGYLNLSLGGIPGPILSHEKATVDVAKGTLKNPSIAGKYTWLLEAKNSPTGTAFTASDVVVVRKK
ncbi:MAG: hypothetical protein ABOK23_13425 [Candidatus Methanoperedens sp.]|nr:hypothetical protein [Candidatus Methanoperedens sp.]